MALLSMLPTAASHGLLHLMCVMAATRSEWQHIQIASADPDSIIKDLDGSFEIA